MNKRGFSLTEILITLGLVTILGSVATVSYQGYDLSVEKKNLNNAGELFAVAIQNCVANAGGWEVYHPAATSTDKKIYPCKLENTTGTQGGSVSKEQTETDLKNILNYTCPVKINEPDSACRIYTHGDRTKAGLRFHCLSIEKKVSGKNLQTIVFIPYDKPSNYTIYCGEVSSFLSLKSPICKRKGGPLNAIPCKAGQDPKRDGCSGESDAQITKDLSLCDWGKKKS